MNLYVLLIGKMSFIGLISFPLLSIGMLNGLHRRNNIHVVDPWGSYKIMGITSAYGSAYSLIEYQKEYKITPPARITMSLIGPMIISGAIYCIGLQIGKEIPLKLLNDLKNLS